MRPVLMAALSAVQAVSFNPAPGVINATGDIAARAGIDASAPVQWFWSADGALPTASVVNGGTAASIGFTLRNSAGDGSHNTSTVTVTCNGHTWTIYMDAIGVGP